MVKKPGKAPTRSKPASHAHPVASEDDIDACDVDFTKGELTLDEHLPEAAGGVHDPSPSAANEDDVDACDVDFTKGDLTADEDLPASAGGVAL